MCWWWCRLSDCGKWCDIYRRFSLLVVIPVRYNFGDGLLSANHVVVAVRDLCEISHQASGLVPVSAKRVRTLLRKRDRYSFSKCHKRMSTRRNKCILIDIGSGVPHSLKFESVIGILNKPRLIERSSPERKRISWEGYWRILPWARNGNFGLLTQCNRLHSAGNRLHSASNRLHLLFRVSISRMEKVCGLIHENPKTLKG
ncbi:hypothetical protein Lal_00018927 [Lupinus albus]|nr:hypothetical protein Lal_00018927 [Lupinus albus]